MMLRLPATLDATYAAHRAEVVGRARRQSLGSKSATLAAECAEVREVFRYEDGELIEYRWVEKERKA